jgi:hypothetical protein
MAGHFDDVTGRLAQSLDRRNYHGVWNNVQKLIAARSDRSERAALLIEFLGRLRKLGLQEGFLEFSAASKKEQASLLAEYIVKDRLGFEGASAEEKAVKAIKGKVEEWALSYVSKPGQNSIELLKKLNEVVEAKTPHEVARKLMGVGDFGLMKALEAKKDVIIRNVVRSTPYGRRMARYVASKYALYVRLMTRAGPLMKRLNLYLTVADIALTPTETATDEKMEQLSFMVVLEQVQSDIHEAMGISTEAMIEEGRFFNTNLPELEVFSPGPQLRAM